MAQPAIEVRHLTKVFGDVAAVNEISFDVEEGEVFGLLGPNGAGKTTTLLLLSGLILPTGGWARIGGYDVVREGQAVKKTIGVVPQDLAFYPTLTARENLSFFGRLYGLKGKELKQRVAEALESVGLSDKADGVRAGRFSGGMKRRLNLAIGLVHRPRLLFLDEPTVGVDPQSRAHIGENIRRLNRHEGTTILYTSHYMEEVEALCSRVGIMDGGRLIACDRVQELVRTRARGVIALQVRGPDAQLVAELQALPGVDELVVKNGSFRVEATDVQRALLELVTLLRNRSFDLTGLEVMRPSLETVFLSLTGRRLRD